MNDRQNEQPNQKEIKAGAAAASVASVSPQISAADQICLGRFDLQTVLKICTTRYGRRNARNAEHYTHGRQRSVDESS
jgi:hypothetical protein